MHDACMWDLFLIGNGFEKYYLLIHLNIFFLNVYLLLRKRERERELDPGRGRERGRHRIRSRLQAELSAQSLTRGSNSGTRKIMT